MYPAWAIELYASSRLMLVCTNAAVLPTVAVTDPITPSTIAIEVSEMPGAFWYPTVLAITVSTRMSRINAAPLDATERNALTSMLAPSNTSGHQKWNGTALILKPMPMTKPAIATTSSAAEAAPPAGAVVIFVASSLTWSVP